MTTGAPPSPGEMGPLPTRKLGNTLMEARWVFGDKGAEEAAGLRQAKIALSVVQAVASAPGRAQSRRGPESKVIFTFWNISNQGGLAQTPGLGRRPGGLSRSLGGGGEAKLFPSLLGTI